MKLTVPLAVVLVVEAEEDVGVRMPKSCGLPQMYLWLFPLSLPGRGLPARGACLPFRTTRDRVLIAYLLPGRGGRGGSIRGGPGGRGRGRGQ